MKTRLILRTLIASAMISVSLSGCGGVTLTDLNPFGGGARELSRVPANATAYQCADNKRFYVRYMENGSHAWIIFPEREFRLDRAQSASGTRYTNNKATLEVQGDMVSLSDGPTINYTGCSVAKPAAS